MNLFLDDIRKPSVVMHAWHEGEWIPFPTTWAWEIVRSYTEFVRFIEKNGLPKAISFDHDLATEHYPLKEAITIDYTKYTEKTGLDCAKWLTTYCLDNNLELPIVFVHSFNPVGRMNIANHLLQFRRMKEIFAAGQPKPA